MTINRRNFLKIAGAALGSVVLPAGAAGAAGAGLPPDEQVAMLYDATTCVGCNACTNACRQWNHTAPELDDRQLYDAPLSLSAKTWTLIQLYQGQNAQGGVESSFVKRQCMHCLQPACVSGCPVAALQKTPEGPVVYDQSRCIGCRYCMYACPFHVPRFDWGVAQMPTINKCHFCYASRIVNGQGPACAERCPTGALSWGKRGALVAEAQRRIKASPDRYVNYIYGKDDAGGTSVLYLSGVPFAKLGLEDVGTVPVPLVSETMARLSLPTIIVGVPLVLAGIRLIARRGGWEDTWPL